MLCNASYSFELDRLRDNEESVIKRALGSLFSRTPRFVRAARMIEDYHATGGASPLDCGWRILKEIRIRDWNKWSILFDVPDRCVYFNTEGDRGIRQLSFEGIDFSCETPSRLLDVHSSQPGDVSDRLVDYSYDRNVEFLKRRAELVFAERLRPLMENGLTAELYAERFAQYPEGTSCGGCE